MWMLYCWPPAKEKRDAATALGAMESEQTVRLWSASAHLDHLIPAQAHHKNLIQMVTDRPGHDRRYAIDPSRIETELGWKPRHDFSTAIEATVRWFLNHYDIK